MKTRPLVLSDETRRDIRRVLDYAKAHPVLLMEVMRRVGKSPEEAAIGNDRGYTCIVPLGYRCCFSFEQQPSCWTRHLSVSVAGPGYAPNPFSVSALMVEFGFENQMPGHSVGAVSQPPAGRINVYQEDIGKGKAAVNVVEEMKEPPQ